MNMLRHIFSFKLVMVFALAALFMASVYITPAEARRRNIVTCPCPFASLYAASKYQAKKLGLTNEVTECSEPTLGVLNLFGSETTGIVICTTEMTLDTADLDGPVCNYLYVCGEFMGPTIYLYSLSSGPLLSDKEVKACRAELKTIAWLKGLLPCEPPPT